MDDPNEKSLLCRIKDCVLFELRRSRNEVERSPCHSRSTWAWKVGKSNDEAKLEKQKEEDLGGKVRTNIEDTQEGVENIQDCGTEGKEKCKEEKGESNKNQRADQDSCSGVSKPVRYWMKMQDPEAPVCCEPTARPQKMCPPKMKQRQTSQANVYGRPTCRCDGACTENN